jgi:hypothetical protein
MELLPPTASDDDLLDAVRRWVDVVASGDFQGAIDFLFPAEYGGQPWTASGLETYIANYGFWEPLGDGSTVRMTPIATAGGDKLPVQEVSRYVDRLPEIDFDVPLDGQWSDLTAQFIVVEVDGKWALSLYDLHVM